MSTMEPINITLTPEMAQTVRGAVDAGEYASSSEIIRGALRDWRHKRALQAQELAPDDGAALAGGDVIFVAHDAAESRKKHRCAPQR